MTVSKGYRCILTVAFSLRLFAQDDGPITTHRVEVHLSAHCSGAPDEISVVVGSRDRDRFSAFRDKTSPCTWIGRKPDNPPFRMDDTFSLRFKGARTDCRRPKYVPGDVDDPEPIAKLTFGFEQGSASQWKLVTEDPFYVSYERNYPAGEEPEGGLDCVETAGFPRSGTIDAVAFPDETLRLRFAATRDAAKRGQFDSPWVTVDKELRKRTSIEPDDIGKAYVRQTMRHGRIKQSEIDTIAVPLGKKGLKTVTLAEE
jgi:hypothetical protein